MTEDISIIRYKMNLALKCNFVKKLKLSQRSEITLKIYCFQTEHF